MKPQSPSSPPLPRVCSHCRPAQALERAAPSHDLSPPGPNSSCQRAERPPAARISASSPQPGRPPAGWTEGQHSTCVGRRSSDVPVHVPPCRAVSPPPAPHTPACRSRIPAYGDPRNAPIPWATEPARPTHVPTYPRPWPLLRPDRRQGLLFQLDRTWPHPSHDLHAEGHILPRYGPPVPALRSFPALTFRIRPNLPPPPRGALRTSWPKVQRRREEEVFCGRFL